MDIAPVGADAQLIGHVFSLLELAAVAAIAGWVADRLLGIELPIRGISLFCGLVGVYCGSWLWSLGGWDAGPTLAGQGVLPTFAGTVGVSAFFKLVMLSAAGTRW